MACAFLGTQMLVGGRADTCIVASDRDLVDTGAEPATTPIQESHQPFQARLTHVSGRRTQAGGPGQAAYDEMSFNLPDGTSVTFGTPASGARGSLDLLAGIDQGVFTTKLPIRVPVCPICLDTATDREHVPQANLGGKEMTLTCKRCNNMLGSRVEAELQHWFDHALVNVRFHNEDEVPGKRRVAPIYLRKAHGGDQTAIFVDGPLTPEVQQMFATGTFNMNYRVPDERRYMLALLKHAYLAACLLLRRAPDTPAARAIRADLIAARDTPAGSRPPRSETAERLTVYRSQAGRQGPPLALVATQSPGTDDGQPSIMISLAGVLFVTWPIEDCSPGQWVEVEDAAG